MEFRFPSILRKNTVEEVPNSELIEAFKANGLPLNPILVDMLSDHPSHKSQRKGDGLTQASRFLADLIRLHRSGRDLNVFSSSVSSDIEDKIFKEDGHERMNLTSLQSQVDKNKLIAIENAMTKPETKLIAHMIGDLFETHERDTSIPELPSVREKVEVGTCTTAEVYFYDFMQEGPNQYDRNYRDKSSRMNIFVDASGEPVFFDKIGLGEHSAFSLKPFYVNGVEIPAGSLVVLEYSEGDNKPETNSKRGSINSVLDITGVEFLRFTPIVVSPEDRRRAFKGHLKIQMDNYMHGADTFTINDFTQKAQKEIAGII